MDSDLSIPSHMAVSVIKIGGVGSGLQSCGKWPGAQGLGLCSGEGGITGCLLSIDLDSVESIECDWLENLAKRY